MRKVKNILFIMFDQLRFDYLSCAGHPHLQTPHIDRLAAKGVRFTRTYVQSPICGPSRMCFYTGRYVNSHGVQLNNFPLKVGEQTIGDHLRAKGADAVLIGKTHMVADAKGLARLGIPADSVVGVRLAECGFDAFVREDGVYGEGPDGMSEEEPSPYNEYLKSKGYAGENPWSTYANAGVDDDGNIASGWFMKNADAAANIREEDSETPWLTGECIRFMEQRAGNDRPWMCHLSYIKPHWPYIVPAPYNDMYGREHVLPAVRSEAERRDPHPLFAAFMENLVSRTFSREEVREKVIPVYMGLIKQADDQMGRLFAYLEKTGRMDETMIVLTSDHGDYLGDHWLGDKNLFHDCSAKIPLIVYDPSPAADATRGTVCDELVEAIDLAATFMEAIGAEVPNHVLEGKSLLPYLHGRPPESPRDFVLSECDYSTWPVADKLGVSFEDARSFMVADKRWKMVHVEGGFRPLLFDLKNDPDELVDLGAAKGHEEIIATMYERLGRWARRLSQRTEWSDADVRAMIGFYRRRGILTGLFDGSEVPAELVAKFKGRAESRFTPVK